MERIKQAVAKLGSTYKPGSSATPGYVYNPIPFPGCDFPCHRPNSPERWDTIREHTEFEGKRVLDYGCATGYFSFMAAQASAFVVGVDADEAAVNVCCEVAKHYRVSNVAFLHVHDFIPVGKYDVAFVLSVLNWLGEDEADKLCEWLSDHVGIVWAEMPVSGDGRGGASWLTSDYDTQEWLLQHFTTVIAHGATQGPHRGKRRVMFRCR